MNLQNKLCNLFKNTQTQINKTLILIILIKNQCHWSAIGAGIKVIRLSVMDLIILDYEKNNFNYCPVPIML